MFVINEDIADLDLNDARHDRVSVASAVPCENYVHLILEDNNTSTKFFYRPDASDTQTRESNH